MQMKRRGPIVAVIWLGCALSRGGPASADSQSEVVPDKLLLQLKLEAGSEYDSNVHKQIAGESARESAPVFRLGARFRSSLRVSPTTRFRLQSFTGAKWFFTAAGRGENVALLSGDLHAERALPERSTVLSAHGSYFDTIAYDELLDTGHSFLGRDFRSTSGTGQVAIRSDSGHQILLRGGYRSFRYKPDGDFDWKGDVYGIGYRTTVWRGDPEVDDDAGYFDIAAAYRIERRDFAGLALTNGCAPNVAVDETCFMPTRLGRYDLHHAAMVDVVYTGDRLFSAHYEAQIADSNSFGQSVLRQRLVLGVTAETWSQFFVTIRAAVQLDTFLDPTLLARDVQSQDYISIDGENRNSISLHVARDLGRALSVEARYAFFGNEFATELLPFRRHTLYLGVVYSYDDR